MENVDVTVTAFIGPLDVQVKTGEVGFEVLPSARPVKGPAILHLNSDVRGVTLRLHPTGPRREPFVTADDCIRSLIDNGRNYDKWNNLAVELQIEAEASGKSEKFDALARAEAEVSAAKEWIRVWIAVASLLERDA